jgi:hypothetical protein
VDRLIALLSLRVKTELRALSHTRERLIGALLALPGLLLGSLLMSFFAYAGLRALRVSSPETLMTVVAAAASVFGMLWALSPVLAGVAFAESHDMSRLLHFPIPLRSWCSRRCWRTCCSRSRSRSCRCCWRRRSACRAGSSTCPARCWGCC